MPRADVIRRYQYISVYRINELVAMLLSGEGRVTGLGINALGVGFDYTRAEPNERVEFHSNLAEIEAQLERSGKVGTLDAPKDYFHGYLSMYTLPYKDVSPSVLYVTGQTKQTVIALAGPLENVPAFKGEAASRPGAQPSLSEPEVAALIHDAQTQAIEAGEATEPGAKLAPPRRPFQRWERDVVDVLQKMDAYRPYSRMQPFHVLAYTDRFARAGDLEGVLTEQRNVLIGKPLWVAERA